MVFCRSHIYPEVDKLQTTCKTSHDVSFLCVAAKDAEAVDIAVVEGGRIKRGYIRKVLSPVMGYGDYHLLHFVFDLSMWTTIGTKKNVANRTGVALRHLLKRSPWTPEYWRLHHRAVLDMQRQCGNAALFRTRAPYERSFPYHQWVMHEQEL